MYESIHAHFMMGYDRNGTESFYLSRELEKLSRRMQRLYNRHPWADRRLADLAGHLKYAGRDVQIGARRKRFYKLSAPRYHDGRYYPSEPWGRYF
jgi:hypothetical protein